MAILMWKPQKTKKIIDKIDGLSIYQVLIDAGHGDYESSVGYAIGSENDIKTFFGFKHNRDYVNLERIEIIVVNPSEIKTLSRLEKTIKNSIEKKENILNFSDYFSIEDD